jgi:putative ABC transport system substrate-binding protein
MRRREFISGALLSVGLTLKSNFADGQQAAKPLVGFLGSRSTKDSSELVAAFRRGLGEVGFIDDHNCEIEFRWADGQYGQLPMLADELVALKVAVIAAAGGAPSALAAKAASSTIPIVFTAVEDPVRNGVVTSLNRPNGNVTGMSLFNFEIEGKRLELLHVIAPAAKTVIYITNPSFPGAKAHEKQIQDAAKALALGLQIENVTNMGELDTLFTKLLEIKLVAMLVNGEPFLDTQREKIVALLLGARFQQATLGATTSLPAV